MNLSIKCFIKITSGRGIEVGLDNVASLPLKLTPFFKDLAMIFDRVPTLSRLIPDHSSDFLFSSDRHMPSLDDSNMSDLKNLSDLSCFMFLRFFTDERVFLKGDSAILLLTILESSKLPFRFIACRRKLGFRSRRFDNCPVGLLLI